MPLLLALALCLSLLPAAAAAETEAREEGASAGGSALATDPVRVDPSVDPVPIGPDDAVPAGPSDLAPVDPSVDPVPVDPSVDPVPVDPSDDPVPVDPSDDPVPPYITETGLTFDPETGTITRCVNSVTAIVIPSEIGGVSVKEIGEYAFYGCRSLKTVTIPESVTSIGSAAFINCFSLGSVTIPKGVTGIGRSAFSNCSSLASVTIPESVTGIGDSAFSNCSNLGSVTIPEGVAEIGDDAFGGCTGLTDVTFLGDAPKVAAADAVMPSFLKDVVTLHFPAGASGWTTPAWNGYAAVPVSADPVPVGPDDPAPVGPDDPVPVDPSVDPVPVDPIINHLTFDPADGTITACDASVTEAVIPSEIGGVSVKFIGSYAFSGCTSLKSVTIPGSVTSIWDFAFSGCSSLTSVTIPDSVTSIGGSAFYKCSGLRSAEIPEGVTDIGSGTFSDCSSLTSVTIPDSVTSIGDSAFSGCRSLNSVTIPKSVTSIGENAFDGCDGLAAVTFLGDAPEVAAADADRPSFLKDAVTLRCPAGASGWATPVWNGYNTVSYSGAPVIIVGGGDGGTVLSAEMPVGSDEAVITFAALRAATVVAALYDAETGRMLSVGSAVPEGESGTVTVRLTEPMREGAELRAFLLGRADAAPLTQSAAEES